MGAGTSMRWQVSSVVLPGLHMAAAAAEHIRWQVSSVLLPGLHVAAACGGVVTGTVLTAEVVPCLQSGISVPNGLRNPKPYSNKTPELAAQLSHWLEVDVDSCCEFSDMQALEKAQVVPCLQHRWKKTTAACWASFLADFCRGKTGLVPQFVDVCVWDYYPG